MEAGFLEGTRGAVFHVLHPSAVEPIRACVLYVHPFAEELNKSRRMAALQARRFAAAGFSVMMPDLHGCGDSAGDFGDARWEGWLDDLDRCLDRLQQHQSAPLIVWGLRTGCLLLGDWLRSRNIAPPATVYWQPVTNGELFLTQFLRLRMAAGMLGGQKETTAQLRARLDAGETLEVAGYDLSPQLAASLAAARLTPPPAGPVIWLEVNATGELPPASQRLVDSWREQGVAVDTAVAGGEPFWTTQEISEVPALLDATLDRLTERL